MLSHRRSGSSGVFLAPAATGDPHLLIFGGSLGARIIHTYLPQLLPAALCAVPGLTVLHQSGARNAAATEAAYAATGRRSLALQVSPFLDDMPKRFARAHLVMSRSGASHSGRAGRGRQTRACWCLLPPPPIEHQRRNAEAMVAAGAAVMLEEKDLEIPESCSPRSSGCYYFPRGWLPWATAAAHPVRILAPPSALLRLANYRVLAWIPLNRRGTGPKVKSTPSARS